MRSVLVLVLTMAFYASVKCDGSMRFLYELLSTGNEQKLNQKPVQLDQSNHQIAMLQDQLQRQNAILEHLQLQVTPLAEASEKNKNQIEALREEIEQLKANEKHHQTTLDEVEHHEAEIEEPNQPKVESATDIEWVFWSVGQPIPKNAVLAGYDKDDPTYVARVHHNGDDLVAKALPTRRAVYHGYNRGELRVESCEVLTGSNFSWIRDADGNVPANAVSVGKTQTGVRNYIGRAQYGTSVTPGTVNGPQGCLYLPWGWSEHKYTSYEVLVHDLKRTD